ncbi:glycosyltransferase [Pseudacidovorax sp. RU35E]|jgi:glycosyltransferase involved in cell wall biosynthesis|uniref:glycosyltransferase n=1 Tax=Pseudacidovorax sp. RU35E TaxID=1907403 RepID=UPI000953AE4E|nr:glycosyltransferase [Pseudacidovorax sp. RU35E]SIP95975.1 Glycosyltransferase involved in cell wall bisynthesis [Pseudacidovorax sp. RU35E]
MILFLSPFFAPEPISTGKYNASLVEGLVLAGEKVTVVCGYPTYPDWRPRKCNDGDTTYSVVRGGLAVRYPKSPILRRIILESWFFIFIAITILKFKKNVDRVICVLPPSLYILPILWKFSKKIPVIGVVHDLQGIHAEASPSGFRRFVATTVKVVERALFRRLDKLIFLSESMRNVAIKEYGVDGDKAEVCYPFVTMSNCKGESNFFEDYSNGDENVAHVVYSGALGEKQNPAQLFSFFLNLAENDEGIHCHIFSSGPEIEKMKIALDLKGGSSRMHLHDLVAEDKLQSLYLSSTIQIIPQRVGTGDGSLPSKLPNLIAAKCRILAICDDDSELATLVGKYNHGHVCSGWQLQMFSAKVYEVLKLRNCDLAPSASVGEQARSSDAEGVQYIFSRQRTIDALL